jgi:hypothetical protein
MEGCRKWTMEGVLKDRAFRSPLLVMSCRAGPHGPERRRGEPPAAKK